MPTLREVNMEKARQQRIERLKLSRQFGASLGVESGRQYINARKQQDEAVYREVRAVIEDRRAEAARAQALANDQNSLRKGEGMRSAQEMAASLAAQATVEKGAWQSEAHLEAARYNVAMGGMSLAQRERELGEAQRAVHRAAAQRMEDERSALVLARAGTRNVTVSLAVPMDGAKPIVTMGSRESGSADGTDRFENARRSELDEKRQRLEEAHARTVQRAADVLRVRREEEALDAAERDNEMMLKKSMLEHAMRSIRPLASHDFQEQDSRRAAQVAHMSAREFERTFLQGPWERDEAKRTHVPPSDALHGDGETFGVLRPVGIDALLGGTPSVGLPVEQLFAKVVVPAEVDVSGEDDDPLPNESAPEPTMSEAGVGTIDAEVTGGIAEESFGQPSLSEDRRAPLPPPDFLPPLAPSVNDEHERGVSFSPPSDNDFLAERNRQFLQQLAILQRRLAHAKSLTAPIHEAHHRAPVDESAASTDDHMTTPPDDGNVSISPMSTPEKPANGASSRLAMTTDQLRRAIQQMKLHNRSIDDETNTSTAPTQ